MGEGWRILGQSERRGGEGLRSYINEDLVALIPTPLFARVIERNVETCFE